MIAVYSFNSIRSITVWGGFTLDWYGRVFRNGEIQQATLNSLTVARDRGQHRHRGRDRRGAVSARAGPFQGRAAAYAVINLPLMVPEIISAVATLIFFATIGISLGLHTVILAHGVLHPVRLPADRRPPARHRSGVRGGGGRSVRDPWRTFRHVTLPLMGPGIVAGFMLAFIISLDDFIITNMVAGLAPTLPVLIYGMVRTGFSPEINAVSTLLLAVSVLFVALSYLIGRMRR